MLAASAAARCMPVDISLVTALYAAASRALRLLRDKDVGGRFWPMEDDMARLAKECVRPSPHRFVREGFHGPIIFLEYQ
jgi:hypothetical protein